MWHKFFKSFSTLGKYGKQTGTVCQLLNRYSRWVTIVVALLPIPQLRMKIQASQNTVLKYPGYLKYKSLSRFPFTPHCMLLSWRSQCSCAEMRKFNTIAGESVNTNTLTVTGSFNKECSHSASSDICTATVILKVLILQFSLAPKY